MKLMALMTGAAAAMVLTAGVAQAGNQLVNPSFDTASGLGPTSFSGLLNGGLSSAAAWNVYNNSMGLTTTDQVPSTDPFAGGAATHITTAGPEDGVYQFVAANTVSFVSVDVYVLSGTFELGLGQNGYYSATATTSVHDQWVRLSAAYPPLPLVGSPSPNLVGDEIFLYSTAGSGADFYVDNAYAGSTPVPEPATWSMLIVGLGVVSEVLRRRRSPLGTRPIRI
ncbi:MAG TPA: PEPxxWA-CTERM sorting domain-containing protein [Caulobacteraceae bacterium]|nr:PEPxxWA-CTERM sorting domain-containing protein [Caulobacteraceae bacterium]